MARIPTNLVMRSGFETVSNAPYKHEGSDPLDIVLGSSLNPRRAMSKPNSDIPGPAKPMPTTTQSNKKTNAPVRYTRVTASDADLDEPGRGSLVFVMGSSDTRNANGKRDNTLPMFAHSSVCGIEALNKWMIDDMPKLEEILRWKPDSFLKSTESEMGPDTNGHTAGLDAYSSNTNVALVVDVHGFATVRNIYHPRPVIGEICYIGLVRNYEQNPDDAANPFIYYQWVGFTTQVLEGLYSDSANLIPPETAESRWNTTWSSGDPTPRFPHPNTRAVSSKNQYSTLPRVEALTMYDSRHMVFAWRLGHVVDTNPQPGHLTININIWPQTPDVLGRRHDPDHARLEKWTAFQGMWNWNGKYEQIEQELVDKKLHEAGDVEILKMWHVYQGGIGSLEKGS